MHAGHVFRQARTLTLTVSCYPDLLVFGMWEEAEAPGEECVLLGSANSTQTGPHLGSKPRQEAKIRPQKFRGHFNIYWPNQKKCLFDRQDMKKLILVAPKCGSPVC